MSRIEEIKKRAAKEEYVRHDIDYYEAQEDIQYLLSKLELAENALEKVKHNGTLDVTGVDAEDILIVCGDIAEETLKQIRG